MHNSVSINEELYREAPAKLNLGLHVLRRRPDGFHDLETVFVRLGWSDVITIAPAEKLTLTSSDRDLPTDERNLCMCAALTLLDDTRVNLGAAIHLDKRVPYGAGLGGGSSDAATTLRLLNEFWNLSTPNARLLQQAASLGSDVPFFLTPGAAYATGRGDVLTTLEGYSLPFQLVVVVPPVHVSTAEAYQLVRPDDRKRPDIRALVTSNDLDAWHRFLVNDFQEPIMEQYPAVDDARRLLRDVGASYVQMSGSGSAVFGVFEDPRRAEWAFNEAQAAFDRVWTGYSPDA